MEAVVVAWCQVDHTVVELILRILLYDLWVLPPLQLPNTAMTTIAIDCKGIRPVHLPRWWPKEILHGVCDAFHLFDEITVSFTQM